LCCLHRWRSICTPLGQLQLHWIAAEALRLRVLSFRRRSAELYNDQVGSSLHRVCILSLWAFYQVSGLAYGSRVTPLCVPRYVERSTITASFAVALRCMRLCNIVTPLHWAITAQCHAMQHFRCITHRQQCNAACTVQSDCAFQIDIRSRH
jgi:hypothetical protein